MVLEHQQLQSSYSRSACNFSKVSEDTLVVAIVSNLSSAAQPSVLFRDA